MLVGVRVGFAVGGAVRGLVVSTAICRVCPEALTVKVSVPMHFARAL